MALNYRRLGRGSAALWSLIIGAAGLAALLGLGNVLPRSAGTGVAVLSAIGLRSLAESLQGAAVMEHVGQGGRMASQWKAAGVGLLFMVCLLVALFVFIFSTQSSIGTLVTIGTKDQVYYSGTATESEAKYLGEALKSDGYFADRGVTVLLSKGTDGTVVSFVVQDGAWDNPDNVHAFTLIGHSLAPMVGGLPLKVRLLNAQLVIKKEIAVDL